MADEKLIFPIGFDLEDGVKEASKQWTNTYHKQLQKAIDNTPLRAKVTLDTGGMDLTSLKEYNKLAKEAVAAAKANSQVRRQESFKRERERIEEERVAAAKAKRLTQEEKLIEAKIRSEKATERQNSAYAKQEGYLQRLAKRMLAYAGVHQIMQFLRNIREVTAEFELQRVALGSIIGDLNEANKMFEQIKAAAVKSPFQIKELVAYTKQLSAYRIETDELFETTQRLADISAGLGVSMDRLVLAYGQIRATGYLRASEVRQLTEAGIPIVEQLAKKISDVRGELISAGDVMQMISERAISFSMVKDVFDDMTSAGGTFYKMQEKQAETLAGQWSNLKDSLAIMYEEIGNTDSVNNAMKSMIGAVKSLADNWRIVGDVAGWSIGVAMGYAKIIKPISETIKKKELLARATKAEKNAEIELMKVRELSNKRKEYIESGVGVEDDNYIKWLDEQIQEHEELAKSHAKVSLEARKSARAMKGFGSALKSIGTFIKTNWVGILLTALASVSSLLISLWNESKRLNKELSKIGTEGAAQAEQSVHNFQRLARAIEESADGSSKQTEALEEMKRAYGDFLPSQDREIINLVREKEAYESITQAIREKIALQIQEQKISAIVSEFGDKIAKQENNLKDWLTGANFKSVENYSKEEAGRITDAIRQAVSDGIITSEQEWRDVAKTINAIIEQQTGRGIVGGIDVMQGSERKAYESFVQSLLDMNTAIVDVENSMLSATGSLGKYTDAYESLQQQIKDVVGTGERYSFEWNESRAKGQLKVYNDFVSGLLSQEEELKDFRIGDIIDFKSLYEEIGNSYPQLKQIIKKIQTEYEKLIPKDLEKLIKDQFISLANTEKASLDKLQLYFKNSETSTQDWVKTLKDGLEEVEQQIFDANKLGKDTTELTARQKVLQKMIEMWEKSEKTLKDRSQSSTEVLKDELSAVEKIYKRYKELRKIVSEGRATEMLAEEFAGVSLTELSKAFSPEDMIKQYQIALAKAQALGDTELALQIQTKIGELKLSEVQRKIENQLSSLSEKISRTKEAQSFYENILGITGDKELSANITLGLYGGDSVDDFSRELGRTMAEQVQAYFGDIDISSAIDNISGQIDTLKLEGFVPQLPEDRKKDALDFIKQLRDYNKDYITQLYKVNQEYLELEERKTIVTRNAELERQKILESSLDKQKKMRLISAVDAKEQEQLAKLDLEELQKSSDWAKMYEDIDKIATPTIRRLISILEKYIRTKGSALDPSDLKTLTNELNKMKEGLDKRNPFEAIKDGIKEYRNASQALQSTTKDTKEYTDALDEQRAAIKKIEDANESMVQAFSNASQYVSDFADTLGITDDSDFGIFLDSLSSALSTVSQAMGVANLATKLFDGTIKSFLATNPIGWVMLVASAVVGAVRTISSLKVKKADKEIESLQKTIDKLEYAYDRLTKAEEKAFGSDYISIYNQKLEKLQAQQEAYLAQADAERGKGKKADEQKIADYERKALEASDNIADAYGEVSARMLGTDLTSAARDFASSWLEAYKTFANTTDAMKSKFKDMIENMVVESLLAKVMERALKPVFDLIDNMEESDFKDVEFWKQVSEQAMKSSEDATKGAESVVAFLQSAGYKVREMGTELSGISKDIATASEESILGLAAGINTQNYYISQIHSNVAIIAQWIQAGGVGAIPQVNISDLITMQNQHLSHLPTISQHTAETVAECKAIVAETKRTADALERVIKPIGTTTSYAIKTTL